LLTKRPMFLIFPSLWPPRFDPVASSKYQPEFVCDVSRVTMFLLLCWLFLLLWLLLRLLLLLLDFSSFRIR
jgi:hypothetical protein